MKTVYFDSKLRTRKGWIPYYDTTEVSNATDGELKWFHDGYGLMCLYRLYQVDADNFIAENLHIVCFTSSEEWDSWLKNPTLALTEKSLLSR